MSGLIPDSPDGSVAAPGVRPVWVVGFFGHRQLARTDDVGTAIARELDGLQRAVAAHGGVLHLCTSAAAGSDLLAIAAARRLAMPVHLIYPLPEEEFLRDFSDDESRTHARREIGACVRAGLVASRRVARTSMVRPACYFEADAQIVGSADVLLTVWDGREASGIGGTGQIVPLARALGRPLVRIDPETLAASREGFGTVWPAVDAKWQWLIDARVVAAPPPAGAEGEPRAAAAAIEQRLDSLASREGGNYRERVRQVLVLGAVAGIVGTVSGLLPPQTPHWVPTLLTTIELAMVLSVLVLRRRAKRAGMREGWIEARLATEIWRGLKSSHPVADPLHPLAARLGPEWRRFALTAGLLLRRLDVEPTNTIEGLEAFKRRYATARLADQRAYFLAKCARSVRALRPVEKIGSVCTTFAPVFVFVALVNKLLRTGWQRLAWGLVPVGLFPALLPLVGATIGAIGANLDHVRRRRRYPETARRLERLERELPHLRTEAAVRDFVERSEELLLGEQIEWHIATRQPKAV